MVRSAPARVRTMLRITGRTIMPGSDLILRDAAQTPLLRKRD